MYHQLRLSHTASHHAEYPIIDTSPSICYQSKPGLFLDFARKDDGAAAPDEQAANQRVHLLDEVHQGLVIALQRKDKDLVSDLWPTLQRLQPLNFMHWQCTSQYSSSIADLGADDDDFAHDTLTAVDELAALAAVKNGNAGEGLWSRMHHYLSANNPDMALLLFDHVNVLLEKREVQLAHVRGSSSGDTYNRYVSATGFRALHHPAAVCHALIACAMKGTFSAAVENILRNTFVKMSHHEITSSMPTLAGNSALRTKALDFATRAITLKRLCIPLEAFRIYVQQIEATQSYPQALVRISDSILTELSVDQPYLVLKGFEPIDDGRPYLDLEEEHLAILLRGLIRTRQLDAAERLWAGLSKFVLPVPARVWASAIEGFTSVRRFDRAQATWDMLRSVEPAPGAVVYAAYIQSLFSEGHTQDAIILFDQFRRRAGKGTYAIDNPSVLSLYNTVLDWLMQLSHTDRARQILDRMKATGPQPNVASFNTLLKHCAQRKDLKAVTALVREMVELKMVGDVYTASVLLSAVISVRADATQLIFALMRQNGVDIDCKVCGGLLDHLAQSRDDDALCAAIDVLDYMEKDPSGNLRPQEHQYITVVCGIERRPLTNRALARKLRQTVLEKMAAAGYALPRRSRTVLKVIGACLENPEPAGTYRALKYYRFYRRSRRDVKADVQIALLMGLRKRGEWELADKLVTEIEASQGLMEKYVLRNEIECVRKRVPWHESV